ncbi:hypothetical protein TNCV_3840271 [Trichonephila clavipes]|nr:hypothetical protein TNCV_3840271 [Trichonephila clavipes]
MVLQFDVNSAARLIIVSTAIRINLNGINWYIQFSLELIALDRQEGLLVYSRVLVILDGRRLRQDHPPGQDIVTGDEVPQHQWNNGRSPPVPRKLPLVPGTIDDVQKSVPSAQAKMVNHMTVNTIRTMRFIWTRITYRSLEFIHSEISTENGSGKLLHWYP